MIDESSVQNIVGSFSIGVMTYNSKPLGFCIKFWNYDNTTCLTHWTMPQSGKLIGALMEYLERGQHTALVARIENNPEIVKSFEADHPYFTLNSKAPELSTVEVSSVKKDSNIQDTKWTGRKDKLIMQIIFENGSNKEFVFHEYLVTSLIGYIINTASDTDVLLTDPLTTIN